MKRKFSSLLLLAMLVGASLIPHAVEANPTGQSLSNVSHAYLYGEWMRFTMGLPVDIDAEQATLTLEIGTRQPISFEVPIVNRIAEYQTDVEALNVPAFTTLTYHWEIAGIPNASSSPISFRYDDNRFNWESAGSESVAIFWLNGNRDYMQAATRFADEAIDDMETNLGVTFDERVDIFVYPSPNDLQSALGLGFYTWVGGMSFPEMDVIAINVVPSGEAIIDMKRSIPHELMHKALYDMTGAKGYVQLPAWLIEGLATSAEQSPNVTYTLVLEEAVQQHALIPLEDLCSSFPTAHDDLVLSYAESQSFARFLQANYGWPGMRRLIQVYQDGYGCTQGLSAVTGQPLSAVEDTWHAELAQNYGASNPSQPTAELAQSDVNGDTQQTLMESVLPWVLIGAVMVVPVLVVLVGSLRKRG